MTMDLETINNGVIFLLIFSITIFQIASVVFGIQSLVVGAATPDCELVRVWFIVFGSFIVTIFFLFILRFLIGRWIQKMHWMLWSIKGAQVVIALFLGCWLVYGLSIYNNPTLTQSCTASVLGVFDTMVGFQLGMVFIMCVAFGISFFLSYKLTSATRVESELMGLTVNRV
jgi:hypothetical protein